MKKDIKKILIIQTASIGDVVLATPLIGKLAKFYPNAEIDFLVKKGIDPILSNNPNLHKILVWDKSSEKYKNLRRLLTYIRHKQYDVVVNLQRFFSSGLLTLFSGATLRLGFDKNPLSVFYSKRVKHKISAALPISKHEVERNLEVIQSITDSAVNFSLKLFPSKTDFAKVSQFKTVKYICIAPTSLWFTKQFPSEKWVEFIKELDGDLAIYFLGAKTDQGVCGRIIKDSGHKNSLNLCGKLTFLESAALMKDARMNFVNDSAPQHFASAMNAPLTSIFCSTVPSFGFGPLSSNSFIIETREVLDCRPCGLHGFNACPKKHFKCALTIDKQRLIERIK